MGSLIFGMNRTDGRVTRQVELIATLGADRIEAQVAQLVRSYMHPAPNFSVYQFEAQDVGVWGALVLWPNQTPPFVFTKPGTYREPSGKTTHLWRTGEWRVRHNAVTAEPTYDDYAQVMRTRIHGATAPLQARIDQLQAQLAHLEGKVEVLARQTSAEVVAEVLLAGQVVHEVVYVTPRKAGRKILEPHLEEFRRLLEGMKIERRVKTPLPAHQAMTGGRWQDREGGFEASIVEKRPGYPGYGKYDEARAFLDRWGLHGAEVDRNFSQAWWYKYQQSNRAAELLGPDAARAEAYLQLLHLANQIRVQTETAAAFAPYLEFNLRVSNPSSRSTGRIRLEVTCTATGALHRFAPRSGAYGHPDFPPYNRDQAVKLQEVRDEREELLPGEAWETTTFAVRFEQSGPFALNVKVWAEHLPRRVALVLALEVRTDDTPDPLFR